MNRIKFIAIDPSMSNTGIVTGHIEQGIISCEQSYLLQTKKTKIKTIRASSDTISRCRKIYEAVNYIIEREKPQVIFAETPSGSQSANSMKSYGVSCMLLGCINPAPIEVTPHEVKIASVGKKTASKRDMIEWAFKVNPNLKWYYHDNKLQNKNEHVADAIAIAYAGINTNDYKRLINLLQ